MKHARFATILVLLSGCASRHVLFDDFNYSRPEELAPHGWIIRTEQGWHLIKLTDRKAGTPSDYNKIKNDLRELYLTELRMRIVADQRKQARIEVFLP